ncbi:hypothetical protein M9Y10_003454 [Tritrichomonas musculus]|uniref:GP63-like n=1 Tax=Tritrichomonas musculus TaxID=1915356 RepID=A0ABR2JPF5_9EUKA
MFFVFLAFSLSHIIHSCNHDAFQRKIEVQHVSIESRRLRNQKSSENERKPIRINLDFHLDDDELQCASVGQVINWQESEFNCEEQDIPNETSKTALRETMENVREYLKNVLLVDPFTKPLPLRTELPNYFQLTNIPNTASDTDFFISVFIRTYGESSTLASAHYVRTISESHRPFQGAVYVNSRYLPTETQSEQSTNTYFFKTVIHEIFHSLGITSGLFPYYHPKDSNIPYENPLVSLYDEKTGKNHTFLVTPYSHKFAVMQWGVENFTIDGKSVPSGIEIEDGDGPGTAGSHPECRIGNQDLMIGINIQGKVGPYSRLTPLTAAMLLDTGFYDVVWTKVQPLVWGNKDSIDGNYIKDFVTGPPANVFPQQYIYRPSADPYFDSCGFTFKMTGGLNFFSISASPAFNCSLDEWKKYDNTQAYCNAEKFYNPNGDDEIGGSWAFDFQIVHHPTKEVCGIGSACIAGMQNCSTYKVAEDGKSFSINIYGVDYECNKDNENVIVYEIGDWRFQYGFKCPPVEQFIRTVKMMEEQQYLTGDPFADDVQVPSSSEPDLESSAISSNDEQHPSSNDEQPPSSNDEQHPSSNDEQHPSSNDEQPPSSNDEQPPSSNDEQPPSSNDEQPPSSNDEQPPSSNDEQPPSSNDEQPQVSSKEENPQISSNVEPPVVPSDEVSTEAPIEIPAPTPSVNDNYQTSSPEITFTENGFTDKDGKENIVSSDGDGIYLLRSDQESLTLLSGNSNKGNLFVSPEKANSVITIKMQEGQTNFNGEIGLHANGKNPRVSLPQSSAPLNLFNDENSRVTFSSDETLESVPISLQKLTISDGSIRIDVPNGTTGVEFRQVETFSTGKIETYHNNELLETSIGSLTMNQGSNIEVHNVNFNTSISCFERSKMEVKGRARFNDQTLISLSDTSLIDFGTSEVDGICKEIVIINPRTAATNEEDETSASIICGVNFNCNSWKDKYSGKSAKYPYARCTSGQSQNEKCLVVTNRYEPTPKSKGGLPTGAIIGIVVACVVVVVIIVVVVIVVKKRKRDNSDREENP